MDIMLMAFLMLLTFGASFTGKNYHSGYISREHTKCINGFFVLIVFLRHFRGYIKQGDFDHTFFLIDNWTGQLIVISFLFYSGYGIMCSIIKKGDSYVNSIISKRFLKVLRNFAIAVGLFWLMNTILGKSFELPKILLSFIGWEGIGNSNWYIFDTLVLYILTFISFKIFKKKKEGGAFLTFALTIGFIIIMSFYKQMYWYNTCIAYSLGMVYALCEKKIFAFLQKSNGIYLTALVIFTGILIAGSYFKKYIIGYEIFVTGAVFVLLLLTMKFQIKNKILEFLGSYIFEIYILQRIPMIILQPYLKNKIIYFLTCFVITIIISLLFHQLTLKLDKISEKIKSRFLLTKEL